MLRFIDWENTSRYSTGRPGREKAFAVAVTPAKPNRPGSAAAATATTANRRLQFRNVLTNFITASHPPFIACHKHLPSLIGAYETRVTPVTAVPTRGGDIAVG
ncbi:hypothetical protein NIIDNTM18_26760 [Mycolicibacterium litorale]|uniref:Uncharacterized protein n=1 Tax=Mycolicibacterium litorale TaxID=758802 RepID=A0A6S6PB20_9MYCO|nr:hypothetical protein NIIDNTM18_26760 [Mycolicibacterium litorale]